MWTNVFFRLFTIIKENYCHLLRRNDHWKWGSKKSGMQKIYVSITSSFKGHFVFNIPHPSKHSTSQTSHIPNMPHPKHPTYGTSHILNIPHLEHPTSWTSHILNTLHPKHPKFQTSYIPNVPHLEHPTT